MHLTGQLPAQDDHFWLDGAPKLLYGTIRVTMNIMNNGLKTTNRQEVEEVPYGMYVWVNPDNEVFGDDDGNVMNVFCMKGDRKAIAALTEAARHYGAGEGRPLWWSGKRPITDEELQEQLMREKLGLEPDPLNPAALRDEARGRYFHDRT